MIISGDAKLVASAFVKARGEMSATVAKDKKGNYGSYATLAALVEATASAFGQHGLAIIQEASIDEGGVTVDTWLIHESGGTIEFEALTMPLTDRKPQAVGSAITYARRYQLASVCGLAPDDLDDDGQTAQDATRNAPKPAQKGKEPPAGNNGPSGAVDGDVIFAKEEPQVQERPLASESFLKKMHAVGHGFYREKWEAQRPKWVEWASTGAVKSSKELMPEEVEAIISAIEARAAKKAATKAAKAEQAAAQAEPEKATV